jgi:hypothetical protein
MTFVTGALWLLAIATAALGFVTSLNRERSLVVPISYLAYFAVAGAIQFISLLIASGRYPYFFWLFEPLHNILLFAVCFELAFRLYSRRYAYIFGGLGFLIMVLIFLLSVTPSVIETLSKISFRASLNAGILLILAFFVSAKWTREYSLTAIGTIIVLVTDLFLQLPAKNLEQSITSQLGPIPGLVLLSIAAPSKEEGSTPPEKYF